MEELKVFIQCAMLAVSSSDFIMALRFIKPKTAKYFTRAYWIGAILTIGVIIFV